MLKRHVRQPTTALIFSLYQKARPTGYETRRICTNHAAFNGRLRGRSPWLRGQDRAAADRSLNGFWVSGGIAIMAGENAVIIKRIKKGGHGGHHGGAWKVAYADFVTAMMAFFLPLRLLNVTTDVQKRGIADHLAPTISAASASSGAVDLLGARLTGRRDAS